MSTTPIISNASSMMSSTEPKVIDSITSSMTPDQLFDSVDLTDPSNFIKSTSNRSMSSNKLGGGKDSRDSRDSRNSTSQVVSDSNPTDYVSTGSDLISSNPSNDSSNNPSGNSSGIVSEYASGFASGTAVTSSGGAATTSGSATVDSTGDSSENQADDDTEAGTDPDYLIYLDPKNAQILKDFLIKFVQIKSELQARDMVNMEVMNPDSTPESPDQHLAKLMAQALTLLKYENSEEKNQIMNLYAYYAERAKSFMFFLISDLLKDMPNTEIRCDLKSTSTDALIEDCRIAGIDNRLNLSVEIRIPKDDPKNTTGDDIVSYVFVSPHVSLRGKDGEDVENDAKLNEADDSSVTVNIRPKTTSPDRATYFDARASESGEPEPSIPHITSTKPDSEVQQNGTMGPNNELNTDKAKELRRRVKSLIGEVDQKGGNEKSPSSSSSGTPSPSSSSTTNTSISSSDSSNIIILRGGAAHATPGALQTEVDLRLKQLLDQSKPGTRNFTSSSGPMPGLCE